MIVPLHPKAQLALAHDVLAGGAEWSEDERAELRGFIETESRFRNWLEVQFDDINRAIRDNAVWSSPLLQGEADDDAITVNTLKRAIIQKSAIEPRSMAQLRNPTAARADDNPQAQPEG